MRHQRARACLHVPLRTHARLHAHTHAHTHASLLPPALNEGGLAMRHEKLLVLKKNNKKVASPGTREAAALEKKNTRWLNQRHEKLLLSLRKEVTTFCLGHAKSDSSCLRASHRPMIGLRTREQRPTCLASPTCLTFMIITVIAIVQQLYDEPL